MVVTGFPFTVSHEPLRLAAVLLTILKLQQHVPFVVRWRTWNPTVRAEQGEQVASTAAVPAAQQSQKTRALVFTLICQSTRDDIPRKTLGLRNLDCQSIFRTKRSSKFFENTL